MGPGDPPHGRLGEASLRASTCGGWARNRRGPFHSLQASPLRALGKAYLSTLRPWPDSTSFIFTADAFTDSGRVL